MENEMIEKNFKEQTENQLQVLSEVSTISKKIGIEFWLRGGWAIDFLLGKITRPHDDIDLVTWITNRERLEIELEKAGYVKAFVKEEFRDWQSDFCKENVEITLSYITRTVDGNLIMHGLPEWIWRPDSLHPQTFVLNQIAAQVLNPKQLLEEKEVYEQIGRIPRQKDSESKKILQQIIDETMRETEA
ncbi:nucleotidyltransferase domain-containing protein [Chungangia koreensis]|uniref:Nucleotidyltransferase domain-containing protein n=1 Tax=Chungangia koreensis TaxID=752657 RepID=A0ABV8X772_9LACT